MAHTTHGYWIPGTRYSRRPETPEKCGGIGVCTACSREFAAVPKSVACVSHMPKQKRDGRPAWCDNCGLSKYMTIPFSRFEERKMNYLLALQEQYVDPNIPVVPAKDTEENFQRKARRLVVKHANKRMHRSDDFQLEYGQTYVVWFSYVLGNWKALVSTQLPDQMIYEVTHDSTKEVTYVDSYKKWENSEYPDDAPVHGNKEDGIEPTPAGTGG